MKLNILVQKAYGMSSSGLNIAESNMYQRSGIHNDYVQVCYITRKVYGFAIRCRLTTTEQPKTRRQCPYPSE